MALLRYTWLMGFTSVGTGPSARIWQEAYPLRMSICCGSFWWHWIQRAEQNASCTVWRWTEISHAAELLRSTGACAVWGLQARAGAEIELTCHVEHTARLWEENLV